MSDCIITEKEFKEYQELKNLIKNKNKIQCEMSFYDDGEADCINIYTHLKANEIEKIIILRK